MAEAALDEARSLRADPAVGLERARDLHDFFHNFADRCHHAKEDRFYFPTGRFHAGAQVRDLVLELQNEHVYGTAIIQVLGHALQAEQPDRHLIADRLEAYARMVRVHIRKENQQLFPVIDARLPSEAAAALMAGFTRIERHELGEGFHQRYKALARELLAGPQQQGQQ